MKALKLYLFIRCRYFMSEKLVNFRTEEEMYNELKLLALKERTTVKALLSSLVTEYVQKHKDGNPQYQIDQFQDPDFVACPAFFRDSNTWESYIKKADPTEKQKLKDKIIELDRILGKNL